MSDLRAKLAKVMETSRKEVDTLQSKLTKVTESSRSRIGELQKENFEVMFNINKQNHERIKE